MHAAERRTPGGKPGHLGHPQGLLAPTANVSCFPEACICGHRGLTELTPYHTHQVIELPVIRPEVTHWLLHQGQCLSCGNVRKAPLPSEQESGYGPRLTGFIGEMAGIVGASRSAVQALCAPVSGIPLSKGMIQKIVDRGSAAIMPHYTAIEEVARASLVNYGVLKAWEPCCPHAGPRQWWQEGTPRERPPSR